MRGMTPHLLHELACWPKGPCVSLYLPLDPKHPDIEADRLALKDLVGDSRRQLENATTLRRPAIDELLAPAEALLDAEWWALGSRGYGLFAAAGRSTQVHLDVDVPSIAVVADRFVVTPLVAALPGADRFYVLAVSQNRVRFLRGDRDGLIDVAVPGLPKSRADALWYEHHERHLGAHGGSHQGVDRIVDTVHGSASARDLRKQQLSRFFRVVDEAVRRVLHDEKAPLVVVGVDFELAVYREVNHYAHLATIDTGNPERLSMAELHSSAWTAAASALDALRRELVDRIRSSRTPLTAVPAILDACRAGRVAALLVQPDRLLWGRLDGADAQVERQAGDIELVSAVIGAALAQGAAIYPAWPRELPGDASVAAVARY